MAAVDEAGTVWHQRAGCVVGRLPDGTWTGASQAVPEGVRVWFTWVAAGGDGAVAMAYYGQVEDAAQASQLGIEPDAWYVFASATANAGAENATWVHALVDPEPVGRGEGLGRRLGDFLELAIGPDGAVHVAYASNPEMDDSATAMHRSTGPLPALAPSQPLVGPFA
jgi:hypothetical protein